MDHKKYINYTADRLLSDDFFLESELHPAKENQLFWKELEASNEVLSKEIATARLILASVKRCASEKPLLPLAHEDELWKRIEYINRQRDKWRRLRVFSIAAGVAIAIALLYVWRPGSPEPETDYQAIINAMPREDASSGNIQLVLSDNQRLSFDSKEAEIDYQNEGKILVNSEKIEIDEKKDQQQFNQLIVPIGRRSSLIFADGTRIWVNSDSKVIYPLQFSPDKREIFVEGEVYLNVAPLAEAPFIVKTKRVDITVLGTQLNVSAYENEHQTNVILVSGKVEVKTQENRKNILAPSQRFSYNTVTCETTVDYVDVDNYIAWKDGYYPFRQESLDVVLNKLIKYYGVKMEWDAGIASLTCSGKLDLKKELADVLEVLAKAAPIEIEENEELIYIHVKPQK
jgi:ferric-dicitrate binding protein FerR (iron transport regulator)